MARTVILTVVGSDRPGLTQAIADAVHAADGNWLESHLSRLGGKYVGSILVELPQERLAVLEDEAKRIDAAGLSVSVIDAAPHVVGDGQRLKLELVGQDRPGIVREFTTTLAALNVNIEELETTVEYSSMSGEKLFRANAHLLLPEDVSADDVRDRLERISGEIMVDFSVASVRAVRENA